ncbi:response regulator transcription factor [Ottowia sp. GY511]|uniref:LuxR C-terminal-related transcriptional regulator n=1 Tax=Ottowia flava TaxID=2675430 RepID=A0ABW4KQP6_9BURK|nr:response regulator transcription factor [Ottowia sp. GY511]TXK32911.1 response regulator transcription factor [Ottowia sp. GY511]
MKCVLIVEAEAEAEAGLSLVADQAFPVAQLRHAQAAAEAVRLLGEQRVELALIDPHGLDEGGQGVAQVIQALPPGAVAVIVTGTDEDEYLFPALRAGAFGYLLRDQPVDDLVAALQGMVQGEPPLSPSVARRVLRFFAEDAGAALLPSPSPDDVALNARESEILQRVAKGFTLPEIAGQLGLSRHTVADYVKQIYRKLNVSSRAEAALEAARRGLVRP